MTSTITVTEDLAADAGQAIAAAIEASVAARGRCRLALSGGSTPGPVMRWLAEHLSAGLVERLVVTWVDERHLPLPAHADADWRALPAQSNLRLAWEHWFSRLSRPPAMVTMARSGPIERAADAYGRDYAVQLGGLDVVLLGAGPDGHIASLFPGHGGLGSAGICIPIHDSPKPPPQRLTLTMPVLQAVDHAIVVVSGAAKASMLRRAAARDLSLPLGRYRPRGSLHWVIDPEAAVLLPPSQELS